MQVNGYGSSAVASTQQPTNLQKSQPVERTQPTPQSQDPMQQAQATAQNPVRNSPTINTQGQTTGRLLNAVA